MNGGVPNKGFNEQLRDILDQLASNSNLLDNTNNTQYIMSLLQAGADKNTKNQAGKTLSDYSSERLRDILNELVSNSDLLGNHGYIQHIMFLLQAGADPNAKETQGGKTLLHYIAECNNIEGIRFLLKVGANSKMQDHSGKTPFEYVTADKCRQALRDLGYNLDDSYENEGNPATPDG